MTALRLQSGHIALNGKCIKIHHLRFYIIKEVYHILMECGRNEAERSQLLIIPSILQQIIHSKNILHVQCHWTRFELRKTILT